MFAASLCVSLLAVGAEVSLFAQRGAAAGPPQAAPAAPRTPRSIAPIDLTGTWVSVVSEDWRWRMQTPPKGDYASLPLNPAGRKAADSWDYAEAQTPENACKPFGVAGLIRMPGRMRVSWQDDATLKVEFDAGTQTRLLYFDGRPAAGERSWQGHSLAAWEVAGRQIDVDRNGIPVAPAAGGRGAPPPIGGSLKVRISNLRAAYLRKNGVPYSDSAAITQDIDRLSYPNGDVFLLVRTTVEDPVYLQDPFYPSTEFKREPNDAKFAPTPCAIDPPVVRPVPVRQ